MIGRRAALLGAVPQHRFVSLDGLRFHYLEWGSDGRPIVLVHGTGFHGYVWKPIAQLLSQSFRVLALDQRGHGDSSKPEGDYTFDRLGEDLHRFLDALGLQHSVAVGHSAGASAIVNCSARHPDTIAKAVLVDPILVQRPETGPAEEDPLSQRPRKRRTVWESRTSLFHSYRTRAPFHTWREDVLWAYIEEGTVLRPDGHVELKCPAHIEAQIFAQASNVDGLGLLPQLRIPALVLRGENSDVFPESVATAAAALLCQGALKTVERTSHFVPMERPDAVERAVRQFLHR